MTLGKYLSEAHIPVTGFYSRTKESAAWAAAFTKTAVFDGLKELITASDTLFITTPDGVIADVWDCIAAMDMDLSGATAICREKMTFMFLRHRSGVLI